MDKKSWDSMRQGAITIFLSLCSVLFLSLICTLAESARIQGARARAGLLVDMGLFSALGEYERKLLEEFDVFFLDGTYGSGEYHEEKLRLRIETMINLNFSAQSGFDPLKVSLTDSSVTGVSLATDQNGELFYQEAVSYMKENMGMEILRELQEQKEKAEAQKEAVKRFQEEQVNNETSLKNLQDENQQNQLPNEQIPENKPAPPKMENPLEIIKKIKEMGILGLVLKDPSKLSQKVISLEEQPSHRMLKRGNLKGAIKYEGTAADVMFQEYLFSHFNEMTKPDAQGSLSYQLEYLLCGKSSDTENLKEVVNRLLLLREGSNFLYAASNGEMNSQAMGLALLLTGEIPIPGLAVLTKTAILLAWSYAESLLDVRALLDGGNIPAAKSVTTWKLSLENLGKITEILNEEPDKNQTGLSYAEYLRLLFLTGKKKTYPIRALDMVEAKMRSRNATKGFRVDAAVGGVEVRTGWELPPVFLKVTDAFLKTEGRIQRVYVSGSYAYLRK